MTKYILHGGYTRESNSDNDTFFREMTQGLTGKVSVLLNYFATVEESRNEQYFKEEKERLLQNSENKDLEFEIARVGKLKEQLEKAGVMYMRGGSSHKLLEGLSKTSELEKLFEGKVIAGSSAGACALSKYYVSNDSGKIGEGLGILNIKCYCHYEEGDENVPKLKAYKEALPILTLPNCKWAIFYQ